MKHFVLHITFLFALLSCENEFKPSKYKLYQSQVVREFNYHYYEGTKEEIDFLEHYGDDVISERFKIQQMYAQNIFDECHSLLEIIESIKLDLIQQSGNYSKYIFEKGNADYPLSIVRFEKLKSNPTIQLNDKLLEELKRSAKKFRKNVMINYIESEPNEEVAVQRVNHGWYKYPEIDTYTDSLSIRKKLDKQFWDFGFAEDNKQFYIKTTQLFPFNHIRQFENKTLAEAIILLTILEKDYLILTSQTIEKLIARTQGEGSGFSVDYTILNIDISETVTKNDQFYAKINFVFVDREGEPKIITKENYPYIVKDGKAILTIEAKDEDFTIEGVLEQRDKNGKLHRFPWKKTIHVVSN